MELGGEVISNASEKPIKFLGRWIRAKGNEKSIIEATRADQHTFFERFDKSSLTGLQKFLSDQYNMVLPKLQWPLAIYDIPVTAVSLFGGSVHREC